MWNKSKELKEELENVKVDLTSLQSLLQQHTKDYALLLQKTPSSVKEYEERIGTLEVKMAKLWGLMIEETSRGKEKLTKEGKKISVGMPYK